MTARPLIVTGTPFAAWLAQPPFGGTADPRPATAALAAWHDDALGTGAQRLGALASGQPLALNAAQRQALHALPMGERGQTFVVEPRACWTLPELAKAWPDAHFVLVAEHPLAALSTWLRRADVEDEDPWAALDLWVGGAGRLWAHARAHPGRCTLVDAAELRRAPRAWIDRCRRD